MKFTEAWASVAQENIVLKLTVAGLVLTNVITAFVLTSFALRKPIIIERGSETKSVNQSDPLVTKAEIEKFVSSALCQRFDSDVSLNENYFVTGEIKNRAIEVKEMESRGMKQKIIVNTVKVSGNEINVDADRIIRVGAIKTILPFPLLVKLSSVDRTTINPYGLKIVEVSQVEKKDGANEK